MGGGRLISLYSDLASDLNQRYGNWGEYMIYAMYAYTISIVTNFSSVSQYASSLRELNKTITQCQSYHTRQNRKKARICRTKRSYETSFFHML